MSKLVQSAMRMVRAASSAPADQQSAKLVVTVVSSWAWAACRAAISNAVLWKAFKRSLCVNSSWAVTVQLLASNYCYSNDAV